MGFLRDSELFKGVSDDVVRAVLLQSSARTFDTGERLFAQGDPGDSLYIVKSGVVEIMTSSAEGTAILAYLGAGEVIGEVALLTGSPRSATARVPERAEIITISREVFEDLVLNFPSFLRQMCVILARRLERTIGKVPQPATSKHLEGHLRYFDLGLMMQTLVESKQTGCMVLDIGGPGKPLHAELFFSEGSIIWARLGRISGAEAVYQLFQMDLEGTFSFGGAGQEKPAKPNVTGTSMALLLESARLQDELRELYKRLPDRSQVFRPEVSQLRWTEADTIDTASEIWKRLQDGASLAELLESSSCSAARVYQIVWQMVQSGQIA